MNGTALQDRLTSYLRLREALGISLGSESKVLKNFIDFAGRNETSEPITTLMVFDWLDATPTQRLGNAQRRLGVIRQFLLHLSASLPDTQVPEFRLLCGRRRPTPFVFSPEQKQLLLQEAMTFRPGTFFSTVLHTVLGLMSVTGLRASEAVGLNRSDVLMQTDSAALLIRESKFQKSRIVPLHASTAQQLTAYLDQRAALGKCLHTSALFVSRRGNRLSYEILQTCFRKLVERVGIQARAGVNKPTLHSLRHSFVVTRLQAWHEQGVDVQSRLAHLATYLGHVGIRESYWYMTATPELLSAAVADFRPPALTGGDQ